MLEHYDSIPEEDDFMNECFQPESLVVKPKPICMNLKIYKSGFLKC